MKKLLTFIVLLAALPLMGMAQQIYNGAVRDSISHEPIAGASVTLLSSGKGAVCDSLGRFSIQGSVGEKLAVSSIGYSGTTITLQENTELLINLYVASGNLDDVVIIGYGTARRSQVVGSVAQVSGDEV